MRSHWQHARSKFLLIFAISIEWPITLRHEVSDFCFRFFILFLLFRDSDFVCIISFSLFICYLVLSAKREKDRKKIILLPYKKLLLLCSCLSPSKGPISFSFLLTFRIIYFVRSPLFVSFFDLSPLTGTRSISQRFHFAAFTGFTSKEIEKSSFQHFKLSMRAYLGIRCDVNRVLRRKIVEKRKWMPRNKIQLKVHKAMENYVEA